MEYPLISVVVPVYNAGEFIEECVESIARQDYPAVEIVLVNDGSTDGSQEICDRLAAAHANCQVVHQANQGVSKARANGVKMAQGAYISFVDADDTLPPSALSDLYSGISSEQDKLVIGQMDEATTFPPAFADVKAYRRAFVTGQLFSAPFAKLIHRSLFDETTFDVPRKLTIGEDLIMNLRLSHRLTSLPTLVKKVVYDYRYNPDSVTKTVARTLPFLELYEQEYTRSLSEEEYTELLLERTRQREEDLYRLAFSNNLYAGWQDHPWVQLMVADAKKVGFRFQRRTRILLGIQSPLLLKGYVLTLKAIRKFFHR